MQALLVLGVAIALAAPAPKDPPKKVPSVVGMWEMESSMYAGVPRRLGAQPLRYEFTDNGKWYSYRGERKMAERTYSTNPKADPPTIDLNYDPTEQNPPMGRGIFKVEGDTLTLCLVRNKEPRPTVFESTRETGTFLFVFKRVKPKD
jgi:uncharacterized protein (TIGR03067 family)